MRSFMDGVLFSLLTILWLYFGTYVISLAWHKGKAKYPTQINNSGETKLRIVGERDQTNGK